MQNLLIISNPEVETRFNNYPEPVRKKLLNLRNLIIETANEIPEIAELEETLKWGEPSYIAKTGSTIRIDRKKNNPDQYAMYFKCTSKLVPTFRKVFKDKFEFEGNRAIVFQMKDKIPKAELKKCITVALMYHKVKHLDGLGI
jgi:hypothetical protein